MLSNSESLRSWSCLAARIAVVVVVVVVVGSYSCRGFFWCWCCVGGCFLFFCSEGIRGGGWLAKVVF